MGGGESPSVLTSASKGQKPAAFRRVRRSAHGLAGRLPAVSFGEGIRLGDSNWNDEIYATADDARRALVLLTSDARAALLRINATSSGIEMDDHRIAVHVLLVHGLEQVAHAASLLASARKAVRAADALTWHAAALRAPRRRLHDRGPRRPRERRGPARPLPVIHHSRQFPRRHSTPLSAIA